MVLEAFDPTLDRRVAVKVLYPDVSERYTQWLLREAHALARLSHPNVVQVYETGEIEDRAFVAMELVRGRTLQRWAHQEPRPGWAACVDLYLQAGSGLAAAHDQGLVHRDFKPTNAIVDDKGRVRVLDFGIARRSKDSSEDTGSHEDVEVPEEGSALDVSLTTTGMRLGTPGYMPPEQIKGEEADAKSDQFSLCVSLFEAVYGRRPYAGTSFEALMASMQAGNVVPSPKGTKAPAALRRVLLRGLAAERDERWPSMDALLTELRRLVAPRSHRALALALAGGLTAAGVGLAQYAEVGLRCDGAGALLDGIWDDARAREVEAAFLATGTSNATQTWERLRPRLDGYAHRWMAKHTEICEATRVTEVQSEDVMAMRMGCLTSQRLELRAAVGVLVEADPIRVDNALELVEDLPELSRCDDVETLLAELPPPEDPQVAAQVQTQRTQLADAWALRLVGDYRGAVAEADAVVEQAETLGYGPLLAEARLRLGQARGSNGEHAAAVENFEQAYLLAEEHEHAAIELEAVVELVHVVGHQQGHHERAGQWAKVALALARRQRTGARARGEARIAVSVAFLDQGDNEGALVHLRAALELLRGVLGPGHSDVATVLQLTGIALDRQDRLDEALEHHQRALEIRQEASGPGHPVVANVLTNLGNVLRKKGHLEDALAHHRRALAIYEDALRPRHSDVAIAESNIGTVLDQQGHQDEAIIHHRRALEIREALLGPHHPDLAVTLSNLGAALLGQDRRSEALDLFLRAFDIQQKALSPNHPDLAVLSSNIGFMLAEQERYDEAIVHHRRALDIAEQSLGPQHSMVANVLINLGDARRGQGEFEAAQAAYERAVVIAEQSVGADDPLAAYALVGLAEIALQRHDPAAARPYAERAAKIREEREVMPIEQAQTRFLLARTLWPDPRARPLAERARDGYTAHGEGSEALAEVVAWLAEHD